MCKLSKNIVSIKAKILDCYINDNYGCLAFCIELDTLFELEVYEGIYKTDRILFARNIHLK